MMEYVVVATPEETRLIERFPHLKGLPIIITGVGGTNVLRALNALDRNSEIINIGYGGSVDLVIGEVYQISKCRLFHSVPYDEKTFILRQGQVPCHTSTDFVTEGPPGVIFDMELAFICAMEFKSVIAYKIISDNCNLNQYDEYKKK